MITTDKRPIALVALLLTASSIQSCATARRELSAVPSEAGTGLEASPPLAPAYSAIPGYPPTPAYGYASYPGYGYGTYPGAQPPPSYAPPLVLPIVLPGGLSLQPAAQQDCSDPSSVIQWSSGGGGGGGTFSRCLQLTVDENALLWVPVGSDFSSSLRNGLSLELEFEAILGTAEVPPAANGTGGSTTDNHLLPQLDAWLDGLKGLAIAAADNTTALETTNPTNTHITSGNTTAPSSSSSPQQASAPASAPAAAAAPGGGAGGTCGASPPNGCGPAGRPDLTARADWFFGNRSCPTLPGLRPPCHDFSACCDTHDTCYGTCGSDKGGCDDGFLGCMKNRCLQDFVSSPTLSVLECLALAYGYDAAVSLGGGGAFRLAQEESCACGGDGGAPPPLLSSPSGAAGGAANVTLMGVAAQVPPRIAIRKKVVISARLQDLLDDPISIRTSEVTITYPTPEQQQQHQPPSGDGAAGEQQQPQLFTVTGRAVEGQQEQAHGQQGKVAFPMMVGFDGAVGSQGQEGSDTPVRVVGTMA